MAMHWLSTSASTIVTVRFGLIHIEYLPCVRVQTWVHGSNYKKKGAYVNLWGFVIQTHGSLVYGAKHSCNHLESAAFPSWLPVFLNYDDNGSPSIMTRSGWPLRRVPGCIQTFCHKVLKLWSETPVPNVPVDYKDEADLTLHARHADPEVISRFEQWHQLQDIESLGLQRPVVSRRFTFRVAIAADL